MTPSAIATPAPPPRRFYGIPLVVVCWILYGLSVPSFYSWGFFVPKVIEELGISRPQAAQIFGLYAFAGAAVSPLVGWVLSRFGIRWVMVAGALGGAASFLLVSQIGRAHV